MVIKISKPSKNVNKSGVYRWVYLLNLIWEHKRRKKYRKGLLFRYQKENIWNSGGELVSRWDWSMPLWLFNHDWNYLRSKQKYCNNARIEADSTERYVFALFASFKRRFWWWFASRCDELTQWSVIVN